MSDKMREALQRLFDEKRPAYHDCIDAGESQCAWCDAEEALAAIPTTDAGERAVATPVDDEVTRAFIDGWNARLDHTDFDMALHFWMLASVTHIGTPSTDVGEDEVERVAEALSPLVNEDMDADMRAAWLNDLARAAIAAIRKGER